MSLDINATLDQAATNAAAIQPKHDVLAKENTDLQKKVDDLTSQVNSLQAQVNGGVLNADQEKKLLDLATLLSQLAK